MTITICINCKHFKDSKLDEQSDICLSPDAPYEYFITGTKYCADINTKGDCKFYSTKAKPESIYESKEDEDLANTS